MAKARDGDRDAYERLVAQHTAPALRLAHQLGAGADAEDVVQDAFVKAYRKLGGYRGEATFRSWLLSIVANETRNLHRSRERRNGLARRAAVVLPGEATGDLPLDAALIRERRSDLVRALRQLPERDREVLLYRYLLDLSEEETAAKLGAAKGTVKSRTSRALAKLRGMLGWLAIITSGALLAALLVPPARAAIAEAVTGFLQFAGVVIEQRPDTARQAPNGTAPLPDQADALLVEAAAKVDFAIRIPAVLGPPEQVMLADPDQDGKYRVLTLVYRGGVMRLDAFDGSVDPVFAKRITDGMVYVPIGASTGMWLETAHDLAYVDRSGMARAGTARLAGATLIWEHDGVSYRLEGAATLAEATWIAESLGPASVQPGDRSPTSSSDTWRVRQGQA